MTQHTSTLWLPDALNELGILAVTLDGWDTAQGNYLWTDPHSGRQGYDQDPSCFMIHHTAGKTATPVVKNSSGDWSKANVWAGLWDGSKLYQEPGSGRVPALVFTSAGPARVSSGYGHWPTAEQVFRDELVPWKQTNADTDKALNRYAWNVETVASGDGSAVDAGVENALITMGALLADRYGWDGRARTIGHVTWTGRKIDPYWNGEQNRIEYLRDQVGNPPANTADTTAWDSWCVGIVIGWAEDPAKTGAEFQRLSNEGKLGGSVQYWVDMLEDPTNKAWPGFIARTWLSSW